MYSRYVAIGDSSTEGLDDPDGAGGYRGWADRLAERIDDAWPGLEYANLAVRGRLSDRIREEQLPRALELAPDLASVVAGMNDMLRPGYDPARTLGNVEAMVAALRGAGATVVTFTFPDPGSVAPVARPLRPRFAAFNDAVRVMAARTGALVLDLGATPVGGDPRLWSADRLHANTLGHTRIAAGLAELLAVPGSDGSWADPLPALPRPRRHELAAAEVVWLRRHFAPWVLRRLRGRSSGDGAVPKRWAPGPVYDGTPGTGARS